MFKGREFAAWMREKVTGKKRVMVRHTLMGWVQAFIDSKNKHKRHQGEQERARRRRQMANGQLNVVVRTSE